MATKSFLKNIVIKDRKSAVKFLQALENAEGKKSKKVEFKTKVTDVKDEETIKKMFLGEE